jgi:hypothetical protein
VADAAEVAHQLVFFQEAGMRHIVRFQAADAQVERVGRAFVLLRQQEHTPALEAAPGARRRPELLRVVAQQAAGIGL